MKNNNIKIGDLVKWGGNQPTLGIVVKPCNSHSDSWRLGAILEGKINTEYYNSCCYMYLEFLEDEEKENFLNQLLEIDERFINKLTGKNTTTLKFF